MAGTQSQIAAPLDACGTVGGSIVTSAGVVPFDPAIERTRSTWTAGNFGKIAVGYAPGAAKFVERLTLVPGESVLDVACGTGNLAIPAARAGASVTGIDIAPNLIAAAREAGAAASLAIRFDVGAAEALPYADRSFQTVMSMFGVMFSARPEQALAELVRVTRPGGRIVVASWTPHGFVGSMLRAHAAHVPPPPGSPSVLAWGDADAMQRRLEPHALRVRAVHFLPRTIDLAFPLTPGGVVELFREFYGPTVKTFGALDAEGRAALWTELLRLWSGHSTVPGGSTSVAAEYLEVRIEVS
jgi:SAM-dependent methyltransferase